MAFVCCACAWAWVSIFLKWGAMQNQIEQPHNTVRTTDNAGRVPVVARSECHRSYEVPGDNPMLGIHAYTLAFRELFVESEVR